LSALYPIEDVAPDSPESLSLGIRRDLGQPIATNAEGLLQSRIQRLGPQTRIEIKDIDILNIGLPLVQEGSGE